MADVLGDFVEILVAGIVDLAKGIAGGVVEMAKALFLTTTEQGAVSGLSVFGGMIAIFAGIGLSVKLTHSVYIWVTSLGN